jgi:hypothetical protein
MSYVSDPPKYAVAVTPSDVTILTPTRGLWIGGTGDLTVRMYGSQNLITFQNVPVGYFAVQCDQVRAATGATDIVAVW